MNKILWALALLAGLSAPSWAATEVHEVYSSSWTTVQVSVSSSAATQVDATANVIPGRSSINIQNQHASANLFCGQSTGAISTTKGFKISAGGSATFALGSHASVGSARLTIYCINDSGSGAATIQVTQFK